MRFAADWKQGIDFARLRADRLARARAAMDQHDLDALLVFRPENTRYLCSLRPLWMPTWLFLNAAVVSADDGPILWVMLDDQPHRARVMDWLPADRVRPFPGALEGSPDPGPTVEALVDGLRELGVDGARVGIDLAVLNLLDGLREALPDAEFVDGEWCMREARSRKCIDELELMRDGCAAVDAAFEAVYAALRPGVRETEVLAEGYRVLFRLGAETPQSAGIVASGPHSAPMARFASDRLVQEGDLVWVDIGGCYNGIFCEATRATVVGEASQQQREIYTAAFRTHRAVIGALRAGVTAAELQAVAQVELDAFGLADYLQRGPLLHGIGVGSAEPPWIPGPGHHYDLTLEAGMTFSVVPTLQVPDLPGGGGVRFEDQVIITEDGAEQLTRAPYADELLLD